MVVVGTSPARVPSRGAAEVEMVSCAMLTMRSRVRGAPPTCRGTRRQVGPPRHSGGAPSPGPMYPSLSNRRRTDCAHSSGARDVVSITSSASSGAS